MTDDQGSAFVCSSIGAILLRHLVILTAIFFAINVMSSAQSIPSNLTLGGHHPVLGGTPSKFKPRNQSPLSPFTHLRLQTLEAPYHPLTRQESLRWFTANAMGPSNVAGGILEAAFGTAPNRPREYGPHWGGFARRYGIGVTGSATGDAIEAGVGLIVREDPRYFRVPDWPFRARVGNAMRLAFGARRRSGRFGPAYARYTAVFGNNFLSNCWRADSEANTHDALLRSAEAFGGILASNAFQEFWPDVRKRLLHKHE